MRPFRAVSSGSLAFLVGVATLAGQEAAAADEPVLPIVGGWEAIEYELASGPRHSIRGRIFFTSDEWQVLFFVMQGDEPLRGSGEGGRYSLEGEELTFEHLFHFSVGDALEGLPASPLTMTARDGEGPLEPSRIELKGDALTLHFPSGNSMSFRRSSAP